MIKQDYKLESPFAPAGDQPEAIRELCEGIEAGRKNQVLLGVTGSGKTFTMAKLSSSQTPGADYGSEQNSGRPVIQRNERIFPA